MSPKRPTASVLLYDQLCIFEFACVSEVFGLDRPEMGEDWYRFETFSVDGQAVNTQYQGQMKPDKAMAEITFPSTIIVPGWTHCDAAVPDDLVRFLQQAHAQGSRLLSICSGVFVLAATGLLAHKKATTHWNYLEQLSLREPACQVTNDVLYVDEDSILTSAGSAAGLDLCLHLVRKDFGVEAVNSVARRLVIPPFREGSQAQFVAKPVPKTPEQSIGKVLDFIQKNLQDSISVAQLADMANMSERTFIRRFKQSTGFSPGEWATRIRLQFAQELLSDTSLSMETIAHKTGFGSSNTLRTQFKNRLKLSPMAYRKSFQG